MTTACRRALKIDKAFEFGAVRAAKCKTHAACFAELFLQRERHESFERVLVKCCAFGNLHNPLLANCSYQQEGSFYYYNIPVLSISCLYNNLFFDTTQSLSPLKNLSLVCTLGILIIPEQFSGTLWHQVQIQNMCSRSFRTF